MKNFLIFLTLIFSLSACGLTGSGNSGYYADIIQSFVTTKNARQVAFLGDKYHYIFTDNSGIIKKLVFWEQHEILYIDLKNTHLTVDKFNNVGGYATVKTLFSNLNRADVAYLKKLGFIRDTDETFMLKMPLSGKRYLSNGVNYNAYTLNNQYEVKVYALKKSSGLSKIAKIAISPITVTIDAILWLGEEVTPFTTQY